jgi:DNA-binding MarR family transcriptional regulator
MNKENDVILAVLKLSRAMRRCAPPPPPPHGRPCPGGSGFPGGPGRRAPCAPAVGRLLSCLAENPHVSSRDLCEILDLRPSSLSEMLARAESEGWITRAVDEEDRRVQRIDLSPKGKSFVAEMEAAREKDYQRKTACFSEEEKAQFCALCNRLSDHLESLALDLPEEAPRSEPKPRRPFPPEGRMKC